MPPWQKGHCPGDSTGDAGCEPRGVSGLHGDEAADAAAIRGSTHPCGYLRQLSISGGTPKGDGWPMIQLLLRDLSHKKKSSQLSWSGGGCGGYDSTESSIIETWKTGVVSAVAGGG